MKNENSSPLYGGESLPAAAESQSAAQEPERLVTHGTDTVLSNTSTPDSVDAVFISSEEIITRPLDDVVPDDIFEEIAASETARDIQQSAAFNAFLDVPEYTSRGFAGKTKDYQAITSAFAIPNEHLLQETLLQDGADSHAEMSTTQAEDLSILRTVVEKMKRGEDERLDETIRLLTEFTGVEPEYMPEVSTSESNKILRQLARVMGPDGDDFTKEFDFQRREKLRWILMALLDALGFDKSEDLVVRLILKHGIISIRYFVMNLLRSVAPHELDRAGQKKRVRRIHLRFGKRVVQRVVRALP